MDTTSFWLDTAKLPRFPSLEAGLTVDVLVVGGGITGITTAYLLRKAGMSVALVERNRISRIDTGHTTAHLTYVTDLRLHQLVKNFGRNHASAAWEGGAAAIDEIEDIVRRERIECEFTRVPGYLHAPINVIEDDARALLQKDARLARAFGFDAAYLDQVPHMEMMGVRFADQAKFHPVKYVGALASLLPGENCHLFEESNVEEFDPKKRRARVNGHWISYGVVVLATHNPLVGESGMIGSMSFQTKLSLYTSYALGARISRGSIPAASFWDTSDPYHYLRVDRGKEWDYAILGGEDHKTGQVVDTQAVYDRLESSLHKVVAEPEIDHRWSGQVIETSDGLPFIGESDPGQFIATGYSGNGMTFGTLAAMMARDWAMERENPWRELFSPTRKKLKGSAWDYLKENKDYPYYLLKGRLTGAEGDSVAEVEPGEGKIIKLKRKKVAVSRDAQGKLCKRSAVCTHMGCIVRWNKAERTWDCPCHGSRFAPNGSVISGPAEIPLSAP